MILATGSPFARGYINEIIIFLGFGFILSFFIYRARLSRNYILLLSIQITALMFPLLLIEPTLENIYHYIKLIFVIISVHMYLKLTSFHVFKYTYINIVYFLCLSSLVLYLILITAPQMQDFLPISYTNTGIGYRNSGLLIWHLDSVELRRNYSIFWEPGVFAAIGIYALILGMDLKSPMSNKFFNVIVFSIFLSGSTTAYILLPLFIIYRILKYNNIKGSLSIKRLALLILAVVLVLFVWLGYGEMTNNPLDKFSFENTSFFNRYLSLTTDYQIFSGNILGVGLSEYYDQVWSHSGGVLGSSFNSVVFSLAVYGWPFTLVTLLLYFYSVASMPIDALAKYIAIFSIIVIFSTQLLMYSILFLCFSVIYASKFNSQKYESVSIKEKRGLKI